MYFKNIFVEWCKPCEISWLKENFINWTSEYEQIDNLIQKMQLKINHYDDIIFEWIPYNQFNDIKKLSNTTYSAKWKDGPLYWDKNKYTRNSANKEVALKHLINSRSITNKFLNEVCKSINLILNILYFFRIFHIFCLEFYFS